MNIVLRNSRSRNIVNLNYETSLWEKIKSNWQCYAMLAPFFILFLIVTIIPIISSIYLSFTNFNMLQPPKWVGWYNYLRLFLDDDIFLIGVRNTLIFAFVTGPISFFACLFLAWSVNELTPKARSVITFIFYAPTIAGNVFFIWIFVFSGDVYGFVNNFLIQLGIIDEPIKWLTDPHYMLGVIMLVQIWLALGTAFLSFIAGLQGIDRQLYESAAIDGVKNRWQELIYVTLPSMGPQLMFGAVMQISASFTVAAVPQALAGFPSTDYAAHTVISHINDYGTIRFELGYASAIAVVLFLSMLLTNMLIRAILKKFTD